MQLADAQEEVRAGSRVLEIFVNPLNVRVLRAHRDDVQRFSEVMTALGWAAESTVRAAILGLCEEGALSRRRLPDGSNAVTTELTDAGRELLFVADILEAWLAHFPAGPISLESEEAKSAIKALAGGWSTKLIRELASHPVTLTELNRAIPDVPYPVLERRVSWMKMTGQIEARERQGRGVPYAATNWLRQAVAPICASSRYERRHLDAATSGAATASEIESAFLMAVGLTSLPPTAHGTCTLGAQTDRTAEEESRVAGLTVTVERGNVLSSQTELNPKPKGWVIGSTNAWLDTVIDGRIEDLRLGGSDPQLALDLVAGLHLALFDFSQYNLGEPTTSPS